MTNTGPVPPLEAFAEASVPVSPELEEEGRQFQARLDAWVAERQERSKELMHGGARSWAAMEGWDRLKSQEDWERLKAQTAADWESGATLLEMLGGARYIEPGRAALCLLLWRQFLATYQPEGPAEYMAISMAVLAFDHYLRINLLVHNLEARLETEFFSLSPLTTYQDTAREPGRIKGFTVEQMADRIGVEALPWLDRLNRMVIRNLRALRELHSAGPAIIQNYGQVNVAQTQTNRVEGTPPLPAKATRRRTR